MIKQKVRDFKQELEDEISNVRDTHFFKLIEDEMDRCVKENDVNTLNLLYGLNIRMRRWLWIYAYSKDRFRNNIPVEVNLFVTHGIFSKGTTLTGISKIWSTNSFKDIGSYPMGNVIVFKVW
jgi:hypothetical protein